MCENEDLVSIIIPMSDKVDGVVKSQNPLLPSMMADLSYRGHIWLRQEVVFL